MGSRDYKYAFKLSKKRYLAYPFDLKDALWDKSLSVVSTFQSVVFEPIQEYYKLDLYKMFEILLQSAKE